MVIYVRRRDRSGHDIPSRAAAPRDDPCDRCCANPRAYVCAGVRARVLARTYGCVITPVIKIYVLGDASCMYY